MSESVAEQDILLAYIQTLRQTGFRGDIETEYGQRIVAATDNSVYQVLPLAIIFPKVPDDIDCAVQALQVDKQKVLSITARGGNTGTNGQSLNKSIILDTSRYLKHINELNIEQKTITVEPGVVLDQLNHELKQHGLFFPPNVSTSSRATIGGMVATDASGKGSRIYGKTSDYIEALEVVMADGSCQILQSAPANKNALYQTLHELISPFRDTIDKVFPKMNRGLTGYNLQQLLGHSNADTGTLSQQKSSRPDAQPAQLHPTYLLAGSEGTLALTKRITLKLVPLPKHKCLVAVFYADFLTALRHIDCLLAANPAAIEVIDDKILERAQQDAAWQDLKQVLGNTLKQLPESVPVQGINFIELQAGTAEQLTQLTNQLQQIITESAESYQVLAQYTETRTSAMAALWALRARSVGLLGALEGERRAVAFVEDTAVPPECLADFISDFRDLLDGYGLQYGMFGHADVGCLHVRPTLNLKRIEDQQLFRNISDQVAQLTKRYGGLLWGEHGRGYRGEYSPLFFGDTLYPLLLEIKTLFDPDNRFNPGKLAVPKGSAQNVTAIDAIPFRGQQDAQIPPLQTERYSTAIRCNGNGQCFSWSVQEAMCPSYKATGNKSLSPKGRAALLREWLRLQNQPQAATKLADLEQSLYQSLSQCLSCKSCTHSCPVKVDIPELKSRFLEQYHQQQKRPNSDYLLSYFEKLAYWGRRFPSLSNALLQQIWLQSLLKQHGGLVALPRFSTTLDKALKEKNICCLTKHQLHNLPAVEPGDQQVLLLPDSFNASFDSELIIASASLLKALNVNVQVAPVLENGKALHVKGFRQSFAKTAQAHIRTLSALADKGYILLSIDVVTRLMHGQEYSNYYGQDNRYTVYSLEYWLYQQRDVLRPHLGALTRSTRQQNLTQLRPLLLPHCMEQTKDKQSAFYWQDLFATAGISLAVQNQGCCGMAGSFGHEACHQTLAEKVYKTHWEATIGQAQQKNQPVLASGFSCRCQLKEHGQTGIHPLVWLWEQLKAKPAETVF